jgi:hypothetical protein
MDGIAVVAADTCRLESHSPGSTRVQEPFMRKLLSTLAWGGAISLVLLSPPARADLIVSGSGTSTDTTPIAASADFNLTGSTLTVVLTNTSTTPLSAVPASQASVLTELLFNAPTLASGLPGPAGSAALTAGSTLAGAASTETVGQNWQYIAGSGVATTGLNGFGPSGNLCGTSGCGVMVDGSGFGLVPVGSTLTPDGLPGNTYVEDSATYTLTLPTGSPFTLADITSVSFVYGTGADDETTITCVPGAVGCTFGPPVIPEPSALALFGSALVLFGMMWRRKSV